MSPKVRKPSTNKRPRWRSGGSRKKRSKPSSKRKTYKLRFISK
jgi:hypothetical protein